MTSQIQCDFSGYATKNDLKCSDGRIIRKDAFANSDGKKVPLVWNHVHSDPNNVLGHALLENRPDGVYAYCFLNDGESGKQAKVLVKNKDIDSLSIYANKLVEESKNVMHGIIREVSLVLVGANPGAVIDNLTMSHGDGAETVVEEEAIITTGSNVEFVEISHADKAESKSNDVVKEDVNMAKAGDANSEETVQDVFDTLTDKQKMVVYALIAEAIDGVSENDSVKQSGYEDEGEVMKHNVFDGSGNALRGPATLSHSEFSAILSDAQKCGSFKESFLAHVGETYGFENVDYLFPEAKTLGDLSTIKRDDSWVSKVLNAAYKIPFSRVKTVHADITADAARALGYTKAGQKKDEVIKLLKRVTTPTTIYKKNKMDRDDMLDITDMDIVSWLKQEMRLMLDEELARAILVGDGRDPGSADKINDDNIRPIWTDDDMYAHHVILASDADIDAVIDEMVRSRSNYKGSGNPTLFTTTETLSEMILLKDSLGRRIYNNMAELESAIRVSSTIEVPVMAGQTRVTDELVPRTVKLLGIIVNMKDYAIGTDKGGAVSMFDNFDIDFNQQKYLMETRCSGALTLPKSALVIEQVVAN